jgi:hypothetical protein
MKSFIICTFLFDVIMIWLYESPMLAQMAMSPTEAVAVIIKGPLVYSERGTYASVGIVASIFAENKFR